MNILLVAINAKYIHSNLAVYSLKAYAKEYKEHIFLAEYTINNRKDYILEEIYKKRPDVLCLSCYIWNIEYVISITKEFHKLCPNVPIWLGGPEVSYEVEAFLNENPHITGIMIGEGEEIFKETVKHYVNGEKEEHLSAIKGIAFKNKADGKIVFTMPQDAMDMSTIPFCYDRTEDFSNRIIYYESSRGCPFSCSYCLSSVDKHLRFRNLSLVKEELSFFIEQKVPQVKFVDRTFNCKHEHAMEIWRFLREHDNGITNFHFEISADLLNEEELSLLESLRPGLVQLEIGVQSTNEVTIQEIHRTMQLERLKETVKRIKGFQNIHQHLDLIAGLPYEGYESFQKSFDEIYALKPNQLQLGFLKVLKGSFMYEHAKEYGIGYHEEPPYEVLYTKWLSYEKVLEIKKVEEMLEVYYNSGQFEKTILLLESCFDSAFDMFLALGSFYEKKGYFGLSHSRIRRCEILLEFLQKSDIESEAAPRQEILDMIQEAMTFDLYLRENCKSRPIWTKDPAGWKELTREFCPNGKLSHLEPFHYDFLSSTQQGTMLPTRSEKLIWVLFSYEKRDALSNQALTSYITIEKEGADGT